MVSSKFWYADYRFRFEAVRSSGARVTYETTIRDSTELEASAKLRAMLGEQGRYEITYLGIRQVPISEWPLLHKLACGLDKKPIFASPPPAGTKPQRQTLLSP